MYHLWIVQLQYPISLVAVSKRDWFLFEATVLFLVIFASNESLFFVGMKVEKYQRQVLDNENDAPSKMISFH